MPHRDATFLRAQPSESLVGFWLALEDATEDNGCLWYCARSHLEETTQRMVRCSASSSTRTRFEGVDNAKTWPDDAYTAAPVRAGSLVLIHANVVHKSALNRSTRSRHAYTFHVVDFGSGTVYSPDNW